MAKLASTPPRGRTRTTSAERRTGVGLAAPPAQQPRNTKPDEEARAFVLDWELPRPPGRGGNSPEEVFVVDWAVAGLTRVVSSPLLHEAEQEGASDAAAAARLSQMQVTRARANHPAGSGGRGNLRGRPE